MANPGALASGYWTPAIHFVLWVAPNFGLLYTIALTLLRRRRPKREVPAGGWTRQLLRIEQPGDGLFAAEELGRTGSSIASMLMLSVVVIPWLVFMVAFILGVLMSGLEGWSIEDGVPYLQYGMALLVNPATNVAPSTPAGRATSLGTALFAYIFTNLIMGIASMLRLVSRVEACFPRCPSLIFILLVALIIPVVLCILGAGMSLVVVLTEDQPFMEGFYTMLDVVTTGGALTIGPKVTFSRPAGIFLVQLSLLVVMAFGGMVIGLLGAHPNLAAFMVFLEGSDIPLAEGKAVEEDEDVRQQFKAMETRAQEAEAEVCKLQREIQELKRQSLLDQGVLISL